MVALQPFREEEGLKVVVLESLLVFFLWTPMVFSVQGFPHKHHMFLFVHLLCFLKFSVSSSF